MKRLAHLTLIFAISFAILIIAPAFLSDRFMAYPLMKSGDEILSHYIWHLGLVGLSALLIYRQWQNPFFKQRSSLKFEITAGIIHGFNYFIDVVESATTMIGVPFAVGVVIFTSIWGRQYLRYQPILAFFFVSYLIACLFFLGWGLYWG